MNSNPYDPPNADLTSEPILPRRPPGRWWKTYFFLVVPLTLLGYGFTFAVSEKNEYPKNIVDLALYLAMLVGVGGYIFHRKFLRPELWRKFFYFYIVYAIIFFSFSGFETSNNMEHGAFLVAIVSILVFFPVVLPSYIALYRYGSSNEHPWRDEND